MDLCASLASSMGADQVPFVVFLNPQGVPIPGLQTYKTFTFIYFYLFTYTWSVWCLGLCPGSSFYSEANGGSDVLSPSHRSTPKD